MRTIKTLSLGALLSLAIAGGAQAQSLAVDKIIDSAVPSMSDSKESFLGKGDDGKSSDAPLPLLGASPLALAALGVAAYMRRRRRLNAAASAA